MIGKFFTRVSLLKNINSSPPIGIICIQLSSYHILMYLCDPLVKQASHPISYDAQLVQTRRGNVQLGESPKKWLRGLSEGEVWEKIVQGETPGEYPDLIQDYKSKCSSYYVRQPG